LDHRRPVLGLALGLAHAGFRGDGSHRLVWEDPTVQATLPAHRVGRGDTPRLDRLGTEPAALDRLETEIAERHRIAARRVTFYLAALAFSKLYSLGHQRHCRAPWSLSTPRY